MISYKDVMKILKWEPFSNKKANTILHTRKVYWLLDLMHYVAIVHWDRLSIVLCALLSTMIHVAMQ